MAYQYAGQYGPEPVLDTEGRTLPNTSVTVSSATGLASLFSDRTMATAVANPTVTDGAGRLTFFAAPGRYFFQAAGQPANQGVDVLPDPGDVLADGTTAATATAGTGAALPATVQAYLVINVGGTSFKVPYYAV